MSINHPTATDLWSARTAVSITVAQAHRQQTDADRAEVERLTKMVGDWILKWEELGTANRMLAAEVADLQDQASDRDDLADEVARLVEDNAELRKMCEIVERVIGERDRARDLAVRAGAFDGGSIAAERNAIEQERDQAIYERDSARAALNG